MGEARDPREATPAPTSGPPERVAMEARLGPAVGAATARPIGLIGHLARSSPAARKELIDALNAQVGNHRVTRMIAAAGTDQDRTALAGRLRENKAYVGARLENGPVAETTARPLQRQEERTPGPHLTAPGQRTLARANGWRPVAEIERDIGEATNRRAGAISTAQDLIEGQSGNRPSPHRATRRRRPRWIDQLRGGLEDVMGDEALSGERRREAQRALRNLDEVESDLERLWRERNHPHHPANVQEYSRSKKSPQTTTTKPSDKTKPPPTATVKSPPTPVKPPPATAVKPPLTTPKPPATTGGGTKPKPVKFASLGSVTNWKISPFSALTLYLDLHAAHFAALADVKRRAKLAEDLLEAIGGLGKGAVELDKATREQAKAEAELPADPIQSGEAAGQSGITKDELDYVQRYQWAAQIIATDAKKAWTRIVQSIGGWDAVVAQSKTLNDFTRKASAEAVSRLDLQFSNRGGTFRAYLVESRDRADRVGQWASSKARAAADILAATEYSVNPDPWEAAKEWERKQN